MNALLDTNVCIAIMNGFPHQVREKFESAKRVGLEAAISTISIFEMQYGIAKSARIEANAARLVDFLGPLTVLPFDSDDARIGGNIRFALERQGLPIGPYDYLIAAQALRHDLLLVTANVREFSRVDGLRWGNWSE